MLLMKKRRSPSRSFLVALGIPTIFFPGLILSSLLGWDWKEGLTSLKETGGFKQSTVIFPKETSVVKVIDGDTFVADNELTVRLIGINAPNRGEENYQEAKDYLENLIDGEKVKLEYDSYQNDKFGRILAYVWEKCSKSLGCKDGKRMVNWVLLKKGFAQVVTYKDRSPLKHEDFLFEALEN